jgi:hypothetical protein
MKPKRNNSIPQSRQPLIDLGSKALEAALEIGASLPVVHHDAPKIKLDLHDVTGDPNATGENPPRGKYTLYLEQFAASVQATATQNAAVQDGRDFCSNAVAALRPTYGKRWNNNWRNAGFAESLAVPRNPVPLLFTLAEYFRLNPERECAPTEVTSAKAKALLHSISTAQRTVSTAKANRTAAKRQLDDALQALRQRLSGLRRELEVLLPDDDTRWYKFGFIRPIDGHLPEPVSELTLTPGQPGEVRVVWAASVRAENYRVLWKVAGSNAEPTDTGLTRERDVMLRGLPSGANVTVLVQAYNSSGESEATEASILVP